MFGKLFKIKLLSVKFKKMEKEIVKSQNRTKILVAIIGLIGVCLGTFGTSLYNKYFVETIQPENNLAYAQEYKGIYVFFRSRPQDNKYISLGPIDGNAVFRAIENTEGKKGFKKIFNSVTKSLTDDLSFENRLDKVVEQAKEDYKDQGVEGIIFSKDLTKGEAIKF